MRFKNFYNDWEETRLDNQAMIVDGTHQTPDYKTQGVKFVSVENIKDPYLTNKYISREDYEQFKVKPQIGDIFMTRITAGVIGETYVIDKKDDLAYYVSLALIRPKDNINYNY